MRIQLNGEPRDVNGPLTVQVLLETLGIDPRLVAVELDRVVVKRAHYATAVVREHSEVEIVAFVGGG